MLHICTYCNQSFSHRRWKSTWNRPAPKYCTHVCANKDRYITEATRKKLTGRPPRPENDRFWEYVNKKAPNGCWEWTGPLFTSGYAQFSRSKPNKKTVRAHRYIYEKVKGKIPCGLQLDHICANKPCVNPDHLEPVTAKENIKRYRDSL